MRKRLRRPRMTLPKIIQNLVERLSNLPSIGPRQATRLVFYLISQGQNEIIGLAKEIDNLEKIKLCSRCFFIHQNTDNLCDICRDKSREHNTVAIVEKETDLISIENTKSFFGRYLVLGSMPKTGILEDWQKLRVKNLKAFINRECEGKAEEIILAFSPTSNGDFSASLLIRELEPYAKKVTRLGRGLPTGGEIEFADDETLGGALANRG